MTKVTKEQVITAILRKLANGGKVVIASNYLGGCWWKITKYTHLKDLVDLIECEIFKDQVEPLDVMRHSGHYNASKPCYTFLKGEATYQVNISIED